MNFFLAAAAQPKIVSGTLQLLQAAMGWVTGLIAAGGSLMIGFYGLKYAMTEDENLKAQHLRNIKRSAIGSVIAVSASGIVTAVLNFYK